MAPHGWRYSNSTKQRRVNLLVRIISPMVYCDVGGNVRFLVEQKAVVDVVNVVKQHEENAAVLQAAYALILSLLLQGWYYPWQATGLLSII